MIGAVATPMGPLMRAEATPPPFGDPLAFPLIPEGWK